MTVFEELVDELYYELLLDNSYAFDLFSDIRMLIEPGKNVQQSGRQRDEQRITFSRAAHRSGELEPVIAVRLAIVDGVDVMPMRGR